VKGPSAPDPRAQSARPSTRTAPPSIARERGFTQRSLRGHERGDAYLTLRAPADVCTALPGSAMPIVGVRGIPGCAKEDAIAQNELNDPQRSIGCDVGQLHGRGVQQP